MAPHRSVVRLSLRRLLLVGAVPLLLLVAGQECLAQQPQVSETQVKAAFLYRFLDYVEWPTPIPDGQPIVIGIFASDEMFAAVAATVQARRIGSHDIVVRRIQSDDPLTGIAVLYVGPNQSGALAALSRRAQPTATLVVSDGESSLAQGSEIGFVTIDGHVRFDVDLNNAARGGIHFRSALLSVAARVVGAP